MNTEKIKAIFTNILFVIGVGLVIFGFIRGTLTATRMLVFPVYPLQSYEESRCDMETYPLMAPDKNGNTAEPSAQDLAKRRDICKAGLEQERRVRKTEDIVVSITTLISGAALIYFFRRFIYT